MDTDVCTICTDKEIYGQVNFSSGSYFGGSKKDLLSRLPFDAGFEVQDNKISLNVLAC